MLLLLASALLSLNANASYTKYEFDSSSGGPLSGYYIQRDQDKGIAFYSLRVHEQYISALMTPMYGSNISRAYNNFAGDGPTGFSVYTNESALDFLDQRLSFNFDNGSGANGQFFYVARFDQLVVNGGQYYDLHSQSIAFDGMVSRAAVDPAMAASFDANDGYDPGINRIVPTVRVPEPGTLGLFALGALGATGVLRRRKSTR